MIVIGAKAGDPFATKDGPRGADGGSTPGCARLVQRRMPRDHRGLARTGPTSEKGTAVERRSALAAGLLAWGMAACGGGGSDAPAPTGAHAIGGRISGLTGSGLVLANGADSVSVAAGATSFQLPPQAAGSRYEVVVKSQPANGQWCNAYRAAGTVASSNVSSVGVECHDQRVYLSSPLSALVTQLALGPAGDLSSLPSGPLNSGEATGQIVFHPDGRHAFAIALGAGLQVFSVGADGALSAAGDVITTGKLPDGLALTPDGRWLYVLNLAERSIVAYTVSDDGSLTPRSPMGVASLDFGSTVTLTMAPDGRTLYVAEFTAGVVLPFGINGDGSLRPLAPAPLPDGLGPLLLRIAPDGRHAYAMAGGNGIGQYNVNADGTLSLIGTHAKSVNATAMGAMVVSPDGRFAYVADAGSNSVLQLSIAADGTLAELVPARVSVGSGRGTQLISVSADGRYLFAANTGDSSLARFAVASDGRLTLLGSMSVPGTPAYLLAR